VELTNVGNAERAVGVVIPVDNSLVAVNPEDAKVQVATSGSISVLATALNGDITVGDRIVASPLNGVAMKGLTDGPGYILGYATTKLDKNSDSVETQQITNKQGESQSVAIGIIQINLSPRFDSSSGDKEEATGIQAFVRSLTGHKVSTPRIIVSLVIGLLTIVLVIVLTYSAIYGSIISIGRNPMAQVSILRALSYALLLAAVAVSTALAIIYLLLR
jgi:hypothetical protein